MRMSLTLPPPNCMPTFCPPIDKVSKAENILKTKGRRSHFSLTKAENILKQSQLHETVDISK